MWLVWDKLSPSSTDGGAGGWAALACLLATVLYGVCGNYTKRYLGAVSPMAIAAGSQLAAALMLALPAAAMWPARMPGAKAWFALGMLALACSAIAYVLFFRLIARIGAPHAMTCAFMIPAFGVLWGSLFLGEAFTVAMGIGCAIILAGTLLATGALEPVFSSRERSSYVAHRRTRTADQ